jgi:hypothetical protein
MPKFTMPVPLGEELGKYVPEHFLRWRSLESNEVPPTFHRVPMNDDRRHNCRSHCFCKPELNQNGVWIHNAFDGREDYEEGYRKKN